ncbi:MAG: DinB family protein, partial [Tepidiformaceae bacterium]
MQNAAGLARFYEGWAEYQRLLVAAVAPLSDEQLALRAAPSLNPLWYLAAHVAGTRVGWFNLLEEAEESLADYATWDEGEVDKLQPRTASELVTALNASWEMVAGCLARWTPEMLT